MPFIRVEARSAGTLTRSGLLQDHRDANAEEDQEEERDHDHDHDTHAPAALALGRTAGAGAAGRSPRRALGSLDPLTAPGRTVAHDRLELGVRLAGGTRRLVRGI